MKTKMNKAVITANVKQARELERQAKELRRVNLDLKAQIMAEEEAILTTMIETVQESGVFMTAREISQAIGGIMSVHEVAGQLTYARNSTDSHRKPQPYFDPAKGKGYKMRHTAMTEAAQLVDVEERQVTRRFVEVDEAGHIIPGGKELRQTEIRNIYLIQK